METDLRVYEQCLEAEARKGVAHRLDEGRGVAPIARRNESAEKLLCDQMTQRARAGEHFPSSLHHG
jgi:hypothetical protein